MSRISLDGLRAMKRDGRKIAAVVCWDQASAQVADAAGVELVSVGDSVAESLDELLVFCGAVRRGVRRALLSCDLPEPGLDAARRLVAAGADLVKVEGVEAVRAIAAAGIPVFAQIESAAEARPMEDAGATLIDFRHSGPEAGAEAVAAVSIPVLGGLGGGPWLDGRVRAVHRLLGGAVAAYAADVRAGRAVQGD
ncbi:MAG TPA: 3-methyl-2-oxobutanoate hydroxymethyltransferase [Gaiellaceae bacterium]|nr:3-methyl-2-oxobutanoate hydroxymethyltransferase [Gaiellaceae bacterium]